MSIRGLFGYLRSRASEPWFAVLSIIYISFCIFSTVWWSVNFRLSYLLMSALFILLVPLIAVAEYIIGIKCGFLTILTAFAIATGAVLGTPFDMYTAFPHLDTLLHGLSGVLFASLGFALAVRLFSEIKSGRQLAGAVLLAICFSLAVAVLWEIHEYLCTEILGMEMMDDTFVFDIKSFVLGGSRAEPVVLDGITKTVIYYGNGESFVMEGYLDIGLIDTLSDMIICTIGAVLFALTLVVGYRSDLVRGAIVPRQLTHGEG